MKDQKLKKEFENILSILNPNWENDSDMKDTPERLSRMYNHFFRKEDPTIHFSKVFPSNNNNLVILKDIKCFSMCPHHLLPVTYKIHIGYKPDGWVLGLSKFARVADAVASYPKLQENVTLEIAELIYKNLKAKGVIVVVEGIHDCMRCRGVEQDSKVQTSAVCGSFLDTEKEFFLSSIKI